ncbi:MAG: 4-phosphopantetheinyl transferase [Hyphomicrobiales bacterium]|nr:4-phosphopantetheinyl transferase [Hyphomicrobiales bacterium]
MRLTEMTTVPPQLAFEPVGLDAVAPGLTSGEVQVWLLPLNGPPVALARLMETLDPEEQARAERLGRRVDQQAFVAAHGLTRLLLARALGAEPAELRFQTGPHGKPRLSGRTMPWFNLAHSGEWALLAISPDAEVGVDLEEMRDLPDLENVATAHFAPGELAALARLDPALRRDAFYACWTRKEAHVKALGLGLLAELDRFEVSLDPGAAPAVLSIDGSAKAAEGWQLCAFQPVAGFWACVAIEWPHVAFRGFRLA